MTIDKLNEQLEAAKCQIMSKLKGPTHNKGLISLDSQIATLHQLVKDCIDNRQSKGILLIGSHGTGKTAAVHQVKSKLNQVLDEYKAVAFQTIQLDGIVQTDERSILKDLNQQLLSKSAPNAPLAVRNPLK